jgi:ABC-type phosphate/phosphonate transport system substrate-binding protein
MTLRQALHSSPVRLTAPVALTLALLLVLSAQPIPAEQNANILKIGTSGSLSGGKGMDPSAMDMLESFIKEETGLKSDVEKRKDWRELADKLMNGSVQLGVFQGYEFAWVVHSHPALRPLASAVNVHPYLTVYIIVRHDNPAKSLADLASKTVATAGTDQAYLRLYLNQQARALEKDADNLFTKITAPESAEDALDDTVDGAIQAAVVSRASLEVFRQRKPGRFKQLRELSHSPPLPPQVVAYKEGALDQPTLNRFRKGLLNSNRKEKGKTMLSMFHLTGFITPPADFDKVMTEAAKEFPPTLITKN